MGHQARQAHQGDVPTPGTTRRTSFYAAIRTDATHDFSHLYAKGGDSSRLDASAPHRVYLFKFEHLLAYKVGITHTADDHRLALHARAGGRPLEVVEVRDRAAAFLLERHILDQYSRWPADVSPDHLPHGGWTECWHAAAGHPVFADELSVLAL